MLLVHGPPKSGKSSLAATAPAPRLFLDVEKGTKFLNISPVMWNPEAEEPPVADGSWDTAIVPVQRYDTVLQACQWLRSGQHPFRSVVIDSLSELQVKVINSVSSGTAQIQTRQWGEILFHMGGLIRELRDLTAHPTKPLTSVVLTCMSKPDQSGQMIPYLQGQAALIAPYIPDITGYLTIEEFPHPDPSKPKFKARRLYVVATPQALAGERVGGRLGEIVEQDGLDIQKMLDRIFGSPTTPPTKTTNTASELQI